MRRSLLLAALLTLALAAPASVIFSAGSPAASSGPVTLTNYLGTQVAELYAGATRLAGEMQLLYHLTRLQDLKLERTTTANETAARVILCKETAPVGTARKSRT